MAVDFLADAALFADAFLALVFEEAFFAEVFFTLGDGGMFAPERRASLRPIAMACFGFSTCLPLRPISTRDV
ncbi:MAG: hypothetical protein JOZ45_00900 [Acidobacteriaceae bacterium]|nr:hypothetical protein [Acidobacteriaceae bacterium]